MSFLDRQNVFTQQIVDAVSDIIYILNVDDRQMQFLNSRVTDLLYQQEEEEDSTKLFRLALHDEDQARWEQHLDACLALTNGQISDIDVRLKVRDGSYRLFTIRNMVFSRYPDDKVQQLTGIIRINDNPNPAAVADSKKEIRQKAFLSLIAEDYLETLRQIYISLELIIKTDAHRFSNSSKAHLRRAQSMVQKLNLLTRDIITYATESNDDSGKEDVPLDKVLDTVLRGLQAKMTAADVSVDRSPLPSVHGYPIQLSVLFQHLLLNAIKFKQDDRPLIISIYSWEQQDRPSFQTSLRQEQSYTNIAFRDNGKGFDPTQKEHIFEISYHGPFKGGSAGLTIAKKIMDMHGGYITADSIPREGSEFRCFFPR